MDKELYYCPSGNTDKYAAVARLSSMLAHKINNTLTYMTNYLFILKQPAQCEPKAQAIIGKVEEGVYKMRDVLQEFVDASTPGIGDRTQVNVNQAVKEALNLLQASPVTFNLNIPDNLSVIAEPRSLISSLALILLNAQESGSEAVNVTAFETADRVTVSVKDQGKGIAPEDMHLLFEPFYTTKEGRLGLGLYRALHIINSIDGTLWCKSWLDCKGAEFAVVLPAK